MNILICGAGEVGRHAAEVLGAHGSHNITVIDQEPEKLVVLEESLDVRSMVGNGAQADILREAGCRSADLFIAATSHDEINLLAGAIAKAVGARRVVARVHHSAYFENRGLDYARLLGINHLVCPEYATATAIAQTLRNPGALAVERFARGRIEMQRLVVTRGARAVGQKLIDLHLPGTVRIAAVQRGEDAFIPNADTLIERGDILTIVGELETFDKVRKTFHTEADRRHRVMIMGGTSMGVWLSRALQGRTFAVRLFETDPARADELADKLDWVTVIRADPTDPQVLEEEHVDQTDVFVALTDDDEHNILAAARAKSLGAQQAMAVTQRATYMHLLEHVGIDRAFSPRVTAVREIMGMLEVGPIKRVASLCEGIADVYEVRVSAAASQMIGKPLKELTLPEHMILAAIQRGAEVHVPGAMDTIAAGDLLLAVGPTKIEKQLMRVFGVD